MSEAVTEPTLPGTGDVAPDKPKRSRSGSRRPSTRTRKPPAERAPRAPRKPAAAKLGPRIEAAHIVAGGVVRFGAPQTGGLLAYQAKAAGDFWERAAAQNPRVREIWEKVLTVGLAGEAFAVYAPVIIAALGELKVIPAERAAVALELCLSLGGIAMPTGPAAPGSEARVDDSAAGDVPPAVVVDLDAARS